MLNLPVCLMSSLATLFIFSFILDSKSGAGLQAFFEEHPIISVADRGFEYQIIPFKEVRKTYTKNLTSFHYAKFASLHENRTHSIMHFSSNLSFPFDLVLICDPLEKFKQGGLICRGGWCSVDILTDTVCPFIYKKGDEL